MARKQLITPHFLGFILIAACGGSAPGESTTPLKEPPVTTDVESIDEPEVPVHQAPRESAIELLGITPPDDKPWEEMSYDEREWYMVGKVHPVMREVFMNYNAEKYVDFTCETCHGPDGKAQKYEMPSAHLSPVPALDSEDFAAMQGSKLVQFMQNEVTVHTATLLGEEPLDPATGKGEFSCHDCHPAE